MRDPSAWVTRNTMKKRRARSMTKRTLKTKNTEMRKPKATTMRLETRSKAIRSSFMEKKGRRERQKNSEINRSLNLSLILNFYLSIEFNCCTLCVTETM